MDVWDWEATADVPLGNWGNLGLGAGMRYAYISQTYAARRFNSGSYVQPLLDSDNDDATDSASNQVSNDSATLIAGQSFGGCGPTISIDLSAAVPHIPGLVVFGKARGSVLFGQQKQTAFLVTKYQGALVGDGPGDPEPTAFTFPTDYANGTFSQSQATKDRVIPNAELEAGLTYVVPLRYADIFAQSSFVTQFWRHVGSATDMSGNLRLVGLSASVGFDF
jgi:hypothetical protein